MKKRQNLFALALSLAAAQAALVSSSVYAATCNGVTTSIDFGCKAGANPIMSLFIGVVNFLAAGVGIVVVGGIIWGGITYIRSNGNSSIAQQGIMIIVNSVIGLLLFIFMYAIINFLVPGGLFT